MSFNFNDGISISPISGTAKRAGLELDNYVGKISKGVLQAPNSDLGDAELKGIKDISENAGQHIFNNKTVSSVTFPDLVEISGDRACQNMLENHRECEEISLQNLETISGDYACQNMLSNTGVEEVRFEKLKEISGNYACQNMLSNNTNLEDVYFDAINIDTFGKYTTQFYNLIYNTTQNITIHFPRNMKPIVSTLTGYPTFGGNSSRVTLSYDLTATSGYIRTQNQNSKILVNNEIYDGIYHHNGLETSCVIFDPDLHCFYFMTITPASLMEDIEIERPSDTPHSIILQTNVPDLETTFSIGDLVVEAVDENSDGSYSINYIGSGKTIDYRINGGLNWSSTSDTITTANEDIILPIELEQMIVETFVQPRIQGNGNLGDDDFAVWGTGNYVSTNGAYSLCDGSTYSSSEDQVRIYHANTEGIIVYYNSERLRLDKLTMKGSSIGNLTTIKLYGSNEPFTAPALTTEYYDDYYYYEDDPSYVNPNDVIKTYVNNPNNWTEISVTELPAPEKPEQDPYYYDYYDSYDTRIFSFDNDIFYNYYKLVVAQNQNTNTYIYETELEGLVKVGDDPIGAYLRNHKVLKVLSSSTSNIPADTEVVMVCPSKINGYDYYSGAFSGMSNLETVIIKKSRFTGGRHFQNAFRNNSNLKNVILLGTMSGAGSNFYSGVFAGSNNIDKVYIGGACVTNSTIVKTILTQLASKNCTVYTGHSSSTGSSLISTFSGKTINWNYSLAQFMELLNVEEE